MKAEKPAPDGADFSGKSNGSRRPEAIAPDTTHQAGTESETLAPKPDLDEIDELAADPMIERQGTRRKNKDVAHLFNILDELGRGGT